MYCVLASSLWVFSLGKDGIFRVFCPGKQSCHCISWIRTLFWFVDFFFWFWGLNLGPCAVHVSVYPSYTQRLENRNKLESFHFRELFVCFLLFPFIFLLGKHSTTELYSHHPKLLSFEIYLFLYGCFCLHICLYTMYVQCSWKPEDGVRSCWNWIPSAVNYSQCLLISEPFPWPHWAMFLLAETNVPRVYFFLCCPEKNSIT